MKTAVLTIGLFGDLQRVCPFCVEERRFRELLSTTKITPRMKALPRFEVMCSGRPEREIHDCRRAEAHDESVSCSMGVASGHRVDLKSRLVFAVL